MAQFVDPTQLSGLFKEAYGDSVENLIPEASKLTKMVKFVESEMESGNKFNQPVVLSGEHGVTYASGSAGAFSLNNHIAMTMKNANLDGSQILLRSALAYDAAAKASNSKKAFMKATELLVQNMLESVTKRLEISLLYGASGLATLASRSNVNATTTNITLTLAAFAHGIWAGLEGAELDAYQSDGTTKINTNGALTVAAVNLDTRVIQVTGVAADITALDTYVNANPDVGSFWFKGSNGNEMSGINKILTNTGSLFGIDAAVYGLWKSTSKSAASADLTLSKILSGVSQAVQRGLNEDVTVLVNPVTWENLNDDLAALRHFDTSYKPKMGEAGNEGIVYHGQNGKIEIVAYNIVKQGEAFALPMKRVRRIGAQDVSFKTPGRGDEIFTQLADRAGFELRVYTHQAVFIETPARCVKFTSIVNS